MSSLPLGKNRLFPEISRIVLNCLFRNDEWKNTNYTLAIKISLCRTAMTISVEKPGKFKQFIKKMGWLDHSRSKLKRSGFILYEKVSEQVLSHDFFEVCDMPDTFNSWFLVTELHIWLLAVRMMAEGEEGRFTRNAMLEALWQDAEERSKKVGASSLSIRQEQMQSIGASFQAALFAYDEGIMSDDRVLASALWRRLFSKNCEDPERLECIVSYVRRQAALLDSLSNDDLMINCQVKWVPLLEQELS
ncbi:hypothetical protein Pmani_022726 [Petrolisthes manimaculis]|uniref:Ubiquinol-cytochrome c chaperone domain-containing protein n=1 Tax=Petrolisthes manimaculis TaxID=1843537 RepID=A0AAE1PDD4_9EUCA|nr:hypothetical protein Pmani_022726 [Petrolisthes manimaculis]